MIHIVCLYDRRRKGEQIRVGAVRYQPQGKRKEEIWSVLRDEIESMLENRYVYEPYWRHRNNPAKDLR
jgi:uncharacterized protein YeaO (DUF488 family)